MIDIFFVYNETLIEFIQIEHVVQNSIKKWWHLSYSLCHNLSNQR